VGLQGGLALEGRAGEGGGEWARRWGEEARCFPAGSKWGRSGGHRDRARAAL